MGFGDNGKLWSTSDNFDASKDVEDCCLTLSKDMQIASKSEAGVEKGFLWMTVMTNWRGEEEPWRKSFYTGSDVKNSSTTLQNLKTTGAKLKAGERKVFL